MFEFRARRINNTETQQKLAWHSLFNIPFYRILSHFIGGGGGGGGKSKLLLTVKT